MLTKIISKALAGPFISVLDKFIPDKEEQNKFLLELEKTRMGVMTKLIERGAIPALIWLYIIMVANKCLLSPWIGWALNEKIPVFQIPEEITQLVQYIILGILGKKVLDKKVKK